jgi:hypothetical protein
MLEISYSDQVGGLNEENRGNETDERVEQQTGGATA